MEHLLVRSTPQPAQVSPYEQTDIYSKVAGYVETLGMVPGDDGTLRPVDIGDRVKKNQTLAQLWAPATEQEPMPNAALVEQAKAQLEQPRAQLHEAQAQLHQAKAQLQQAGAARTAAEAARPRWRVVPHRSPRWAGAQACSAATPSRSAVWYSHRSPP